MATEIDWYLIARAMAYYQLKGFTTLEMPWHVSREVSAITCPNQSRAYAFEDGVLVGSAEQSFMEAQFAGTLGEGKFVTCTPCFRNEPVRDSLHLPYFMKVELYSTEGDHRGRALQFAELALKFVRDCANERADIVPTDEGYDLQLHGIEIGSYSTREHNGFTWTCGTGIAEPRFTTAKRRLQKP